MAAKRKAKPKSKRKPDRDRVLLERYLSKIKRKSAPARKRKPMTAKSPPRKPEPKQEPKRQPKSEPDKNEHDRAETEGVKHEAHELEPERPVTTGRAELGYPSPTDPDHPERGVTDDPSLPGYQPPDKP